jgi:fumarylacetoacetase
MIVETHLLTSRMASTATAPHRLARATLQDLYWTPAQLIAHHTSNGCNLCPGDLVGTGTVSGPEEADAGCMLELTRRGSRPLLLPNQEQRRWLEDGDEIIIRAYCARDGYATIGFGECRGRIGPTCR